MKKLLLPIISAFLGLTFVGMVQADTSTNCTPIYGGGTNCATTGLIVDKKVKHPTQNQFVDNLNVNDPKYQGDQAITFRISVKNSGATELKGVTVTDTLPNYLKDITSSGSAEAKSNLITHKFDTMKAGETKSFDIQAHIVAESQLPAQDTTCVTNTVVAYTGSIKAEDAAAYCMQVLTDIPTTKGGVPVNPEPTAVPTRVPGTGTTTKGGQPVYPTTNTTTTPNTGPEALALLALIPGGLLGQYLRRKAK